MPDQTSHDINNNRTERLYFFLPFLPLEPVLELLEATLEALDGAAELALLDLTLSRALFWGIMSVLNFEAGWMRY